MESHAAINAPEVRNSRFENTGVIICEQDGSIRSTSPQVRSLLGSDAGDGSLKVRFQGSPEFAEWSTRALDQASKGETSESLVRCEVGMIRATAVALDDGSVAIALARADVGDRVVSPEAVARKTWHDIQNQLGGLKLYATFLKRKLGDADDQVRETADKIVAGIDAVAQSIANARRGEGGR
jgi:hypothetical protein